VDGKLIRPPRGANTRDIDPSKPNPEKQIIALYPPEDLPPGDSKETHLVDRKAAIRKGVEAALPGKAP
jgi:hypothetical protein